MLVCFFNDYTIYSNCEKKCKQEQQKILKTGGEKDASPISRMQYEWNDSDYIYQQTFYIMCTALSCFKKFNHLNGGFFLTESRL